MSAEPSPALLKVNFGAAELVIKKLLPVMFPVAVILSKVTSSVVPTL